jgi:hypothetical protein
MNYASTPSFGRRNSKDLTDQNIVLGPIQLFGFYKIYLQSSSFNFKNISKPRVESQTTLL